MTPFTCGCTEDGTERCPTHATYPCHDNEHNYGTPPSSLQCPPCHLARLRSVSLDGRATPTRRMG